MLVTSVLCALAPSVGTLIGARVFQGVGAALVVPTSLALLNGSLLKSDRARAIGIWHRRCNVPYQELEERLAKQPVIPVPAFTLDGLADGNFSATDATASAGHFAGPRVHRQVPDAGAQLAARSTEGVR